MVGETRRERWELRWRGGGIVAARFLPTSERVEGGRSADPEEWEAEEIEALLCLPECTGIERLEIDMVDFHRSPERAALALAARERPVLTRLHFGVIGRDAHRWSSSLANQPTSSIGRTIDVAALGPDLVSSDVANALWQALPALEELGVCGDGIFAGIRHARLRVLWARAGTEAISGLIFGRHGRVAGGPRALPTLPALRALVAFAEADDWGGTPAATLLELDAERYPQLECLDLRGVELDPDEDGVLLTIARLPIVSRLRTLGIPALHADDLGDAAAFAEARDRLRHLDRLLAAAAWSEVPPYREAFPQLVVEAPSVATHLGAFDDDDA
jgi:hypothetical protein